jgi:hypothetical protein
MPAGWCGNGRRLLLDLRSRAENAEIAEDCNYLLTQSHKARVGGHVSGNFDGDISLYSIGNIQRTRVHTG